MGLSEPLWSIPDLIDRYALFLVGIGIVIAARLFNALVASFAI